MPIQIRRLRPGEADQIVGADPLFDDATDPRAAAAYLRDPANVLFLARDGREPVGFLRGTALRQLKTKRRQMFLYEIAVAPSHRRRGIGRALVARFLEYCRRQRCEEAFVFTDPGNTPAVRLYRTTGAVTETPADRMFVYAFPSPKRVGPPSPRRPRAPKLGRRRGRRAGGPIVK